MIATVIQGKTYAEILSLLDDPWVELAEIRLDLCPLSDAEIEDLFANTDTPLIATCRANWNAAGAAGEATASPASGLPHSSLSPAEAERRLTIAIQAGARFADLEIEAEAGWSKRFRDLCHDYGVEIIRSWHDFSATPSLDYLRQIQARCYRYGADIAKIVTTATSPADCETVLSLYEEEPSENETEPRRLIAFAMGPVGRETRLECLRLGSPFSYAGVPEEVNRQKTPKMQVSPSKNGGIPSKSPENDGCPIDAAAPIAPVDLGQYGYEEMHRLVYGNFRGFWRVGGDLAVPCSKSFAQRAIVCAALAEGRSRLRSYTPCADSEAALAVARTLGATVRKEAPGASDPAASTTLVIDGIGVAPGQALAAPGTPSHSAPTLAVGESGLLARICIPLMAAIADRPVTITGEKTLLHRPLKGVQNVMASFGVPIRSELVPITVAPPLIPGNAEVSGADGSQIISGLLTALPLCGKNSTLYISEPKSIPYMFITEDILRKFGVRVKSEMEGDERMIEDQDWSGCSQVSFSIKGGQHYKAADLTLEGDWSAAANFLVAGAIFGKAEVSGLNTDSLQADLAIADILVQAGAVVSELDESVCVSKAPLEGFEADLANAPDLFPICSVLAAFCDGETVLHGVDRLHGKESDRAAAILEMLTAFGVPATIDGNDLYITGETLASRLLNGRLLHGSGTHAAARTPATLAATPSTAAPARVFPTHGDHRIAMALKIASMGADSPVVLDDPSCVAKSFPEFWEQFDY